jgi:hypothetical protein
MFQQLLLALSSMNRQYFLLWRGRSRKKLAKWTCLLHRFIRQHMKPAAALEVLKCVQQFLEDLWWREKLALMYGVSDLTAWTA